MCFRERPRPATMTLPMSFTAAELRAAMPTVHPRQRGPIGPSPDGCQIQWWLRFARRFVERELPPADVAPRTELVADVLVHANRSKSDALVQRNARRVGERNPSVRVEESLCGQDREQRSIESLSNAAPLKVWMHGDRRVHRPAVRAPHAMFRRVRVAGDLPLSLAD